MRIHNYNVEQSICILKAINGLEFVECCHLVGDQHAHYAREVLVGRTLLATWATFLDNAEWSPASEKFV